MYIRCGELVFIVCANVCSFVLGVELCMQTIVSVGAYVNSPVRSFPLGLFGSNCLCVYMHRYVVLGIPQVKCVFKDSCVSVRTYSVSPTRWWTHTVGSYKLLCMD